MKLRYYSKKPLEACFEWVHVEFMTKEAHPFAPDGKVSLLIDPSSGLLQNWAYGPVEADVRPDGPFRVSLLDGELNRVLHTVLLEPFDVMGFLTYGHADLRIDEKGELLTFGADFMGLFGTDGAFGVDGWEY
jgi:hypothetical protein